MPDAPDQRQPPAPTRPPRRVPVSQMDAMSRWILRGGMGLTVLGLVTGGCGVALVAIPSVVVVVLVMAGVGAGGGSIGGVFLAVMLASLGVVLLAAAATLGGVALTLIVPGVALWGAIVMGRWRSRVAHDG